MDILIKPAEEKDYKSYEALFDEAEQFFRRSADDPVRTTTHEDFISLLSDPHRKIFLAFKDGNEPIGFSDGEVMSSDQMGPDGKPMQAHLGKLYISASGRSRGIGRKLINAYEHWAVLQGARELTLWVRTKEASALHLYESEGYRTNFNTLAATATSAPEKTVNIRPAHRDDWQQYKMLLKEPGRYVHDAQVNLDKDIFTNIAEDPRGNDLYVYEESGFIRAFAFIQTSYHNVPGDNNISSLRMAHFVMAAKMDQQTRADFLRTLQSEFRKRTESAVPMMSNVGESDIHAKSLLQEGGFTATNFYMKKTLNL